MKASELVRILSGKIEEVGDVDVFWGCACESMMDGIDENSIEVFTANGEKAIVIDANEAAYWQEYHDNMVMLV